MNELGLLKLACQSADPRLKHSWPLEFNLRQEVTEGGREQTASAEESGVEGAKLEAARVRMRSLFSRPLDRRDKLSATNLLKNLEQVFALQKANWNGVLIRQLWQTLSEQIDRRKESIDHEETWLILAGFFLRPGFGAAGDEIRIDNLWQLRADGLFHPGKRSPTSGIYSLETRLRWAQPSTPASGPRARTPKAALFKEPKSGAHSPRWISRKNAAKP